jgi:glucosamine-phosphate N-acetyltransferase
MERYTVREIRARDLNHGFLDALRNLSEVGELTQPQLVRILARVKKNPFHRIFVAVSEDGAVLGTSTLLIEPKFSHSGGLAGHIEDVSVRGDMTGKGVGRALVEATVAYARRKGCYKCILSCKDDNVKFYEKFGFRVHEREMRLDLKPV